MIDYLRLGSVPPKHHIAHRRPAVGADGCPVYYEHCLTRGGFDGPYSIMYRKNNPGQEVRIDRSPIVYDVDWVDPAAETLQRTHVPSKGLAGKGSLWESHRVLMGNDDLHVGTAEPTEPDSGLFQNGDGDLLMFIHEGSGVLESELGRLAFQRHDYVWIPKGVVCRIVFGQDAAGGGADAAAGERAPAGKGAAKDAALAHVMVNECRRGLQIPSNFLNPVGQCKMDAPYSHRDFRRPVALSEPQKVGKGGVRVLHKRKDQYAVRVLPHHPFDVVGFDGTVYPVAFNIHDYQPKTSTVHLPPPIHTTFLGGAGSFVVCSFVPRKVDYHPDAIPCPYPHSSVDCDEVLWYVEGDFTSRKGVGPGSLSLHPMGIPHAPQPGRYEASMGHERTNELAVMVDTFRPLRLSKTAFKARDKDYHPSWWTGDEAEDLIL